MARGVALHCFTGHFSWGGWMVKDLGFGRDFHVGKAAGEEIRDKVCVPNSQRETAVSRANTHQRAATAGETLHIRWKK